MRNVETSAGKHSVEGLQMENDAKSGQRPLGQGGGSQVWFIEVVPIRSHTMGHEGWIEFEYRGHLGTELPKKTSQGMEVKICLIFSDNYEN